MGRRAARDGLRGQGLRWLTLSLLICGCARGAVGAPEVAPPSCDPQSDIPGFTIEVEGRRKQRFQPTRVPFEARQAGLRVALTRQGDVFELVVRSLGARVDRVFFPWLPAPDGPGRPGDRFLLPHALGTALPLGAMLEGRVYGCVYPGKCFSPVVVRELGGRASLLAAVNWPPRWTEVSAGGRGFGLMDREPVAPGQQRRYRALSVARCGADPWRAAAGVYRDWLQSQMHEAGLLPVVQSEELKRSQGWWSVHLQNMPRYETAYLERGWKVAGPRFGWIQIWGQMSTFAGTPRVARPPPAPGEKVGCCLTRLELHPRYREELPDFLRAVAREGRAGLYLSAGPGPLFGPDGRETAALARLRAWMKANREQGADALYVDVMGNAYLGDPLRVARLLTEPSFRDVVIEYPVDLYPAAYLCSGSLEYGKWKAEYRLAPDTRHMFPRLGRTILPERILFLGENNTGVPHFGSSGGYWVQRQAFLLGAKLDVIHLKPGGRVPGDPLGVVDEILEERRRAHWWELEAVYRDREGLALPDGVDARRFRGKGGEDLVAAVNWKERRGLRLRVDGRELELPRRRFAILRVPPPGAVTNPTPAAPATAAPR